MKTTLFMLMSLDGKISTGSSNERDFDKDVPTLPGAADGLAQYYKLEKKTDYYSFNTGKVFAKVGWNDQKNEDNNIPVKFIIVDNKPHLTDTGVKNLLRRSRGLYIVTTNNNHPAHLIKDTKLTVLDFNTNIDFEKLFHRLDQTHGIKQMTIQSGGTINAELLRAGLINELSIVVAPVLVGGRNTPSLIDGESLNNIDDLHKIKTLELLEITRLDHDYLHLRYNVR